MRFSSCLLAGASAAMFVLAAGAPEAKASGFALKEQSTTALGNAFAGATAAADDISYSFFNPAAMALADEAQAVGVSSLIIPQSELNGSTSALGPIPVAGGNGGSDFARDALVPAFYGVMPINDYINVGLAINAPFGLVTSYEDGFAGRFHGLHSRLTTITVNPIVGIKVNDWIQVGAGPLAQYSDARLTSATVLGVGPGPTLIEGRSAVTGDDWGFGGRAGILMQPFDGTQIGIGYRSHVEHTLEGQIKVGDGAGTTILSGPGTADLTTPESVSFGIEQMVTDEISLMFEAEWTNWSRFEELRVQSPALPADSVVDESWEDTWFFGLGGTYRPMEMAGWTFRGGVAYDMSPVPDAAHRTPRVPDSDRYWIALGASYELYDWLSLDAGYTHIFVADADIRLPGDATTPAFSANVDASIDIVTIGGRIRF